MGCMKYFTFILVVLLAIFIYESARSFILAKKSAELIKSTKPFNRRVELPTSRILVLGDSTAYGTGVTSGKYSTAGRLGEYYPNADITNISRNGLKIKGLIKILDTLDQKEEKKEKYDLVLIQIGANDIIRLTSKDEIEEGIKEVLSLVKEKGPKVVLLHSGDIGETKFFPWFLRPLLSKRSKEVREIYLSQTKAYGANYVDLINSPIASKLRENPDLYYANDFLHLSDEGYGLWFTEIKKHL